MSSGNSRVRAELTFFLSFYDLFDKFLFAFFLFLPILIQFFVFIIGLFPLNIGNLPIYLNISYNIHISDENLETHEGVK